MSSYSNILRFAFVIIFVLLAIFYIPKVEFDNSLSRWIPESATEISEYESFLGDFSGDAIIIVAIENANSISNSIKKEILTSLRNEVGELHYVNSVTKWPLPFFHLKTPASENVYSIVISFNPESSLRPNRPELIHKIESLLGNSQYKYHLAGTGVITDALNNEARESTIKFLSIGLLILIISLFFLLRNPIHIVMTLSVSFGSVCSMLIFSALFDIPFSMIGVILPVLMLFYGTSDSLHVLFHDGNFTKVFIPCILTTLTTSAGFMVFLFDPIPLLKDFALLGISGLLGGLLWIVVLFYPKTISFHPNNIVTNIYRAFQLPLSKSTLFIILILLVFMIPGIARIRADIHSLKVLSPFNHRALDHHFIEKNISNYVPIEYTIDIDQVDTTSLKKWTNSVLDLHEVSGVLSYLDFSSYVLSLVPHKIYPKQHGYISKDGKRGRITFLVPLLSTTDGISLVNEIDLLAYKYLGDSQPKITGYVTIYSRIADELSKTFIKSLLIAFVVVFLIILLYLRDLRLFLASLLPNIFPILIIVGIMGWFNIPLDMVTVPIGSLILGIIVDDSIHYLYWFKKTKELKATFLGAAPGIVFTTIVIVLGFSVFLVSHVPPIRYFGVLSITALVSALICDIFLLPLMIRFLNK